MKRKRVGILFAALLIFCLAGCGSAETDENTVLTDEDFISNLEKGLENRWDISDRDTTLMSTSEAQEYLTECIEAETEEVLSMDRYTFEDKALESLAQQYFDALDLQKEGIKYAGTEDYTSYEQTFTMGYNYRITLIHQFYQDYGLTVGGKYQTTLDDVLAEYDVAAKQVAIQEYVNEISSTLNYTKDEEESDEYSTYYSAVIENTTGYTIDSLEIHLSFVDADGVTIEKTSDFISNFNAGAKYKSSIYVDVDEFDHIEYNVIAYSF